MWIDVKIHFIPETTCNIPIFLPTCFNTEFVVSNLNDCCVYLLLLIVVINEGFFNVTTEMFVFFLL